MSADYLRDGCGKTWPRDPVFEVACPTCQAAVGAECATLAPSGHRKNRKFAPIPGGCHPARDIAAVHAGAYGDRCPLGRCHTTPDDLVSAATVGRRPTRAPQLDLLAAGGGR